MQVNANLRKRPRSDEDSIEKSGNHFDYMLAEAFS
jgi:hypothetical protein